MLEQLSREELRRLAHTAEHLLAGRPVPEYGARVRRPRAGLGTEFLDFREYRPGDDFRHIDWRASARSPRPVVRRHIEETRSDWMVCLDASASMGAADQGCWRHGALLAAAYSHVLLHLGHRTGLVIYADAAVHAVPAGRGHQHLASILRTLASTTPVSRGGASEPAVCAPHLGSATSVLLISDLLPARHHVEALQSLRAFARDLHVLQLVGDSAAEADGAGAARLVDLETGAELPVMRSAELRTAVTRATQKHTDTMAQHCHRLGLVHTACPVNERWSKNITAHLQALGLRRA
ncbi:MAG: DUF58 domain-containing protein [Pseudomonadota bacterium]